MRSIGSSWNDDLEIFYVIIDFTESEMNERQAQFIKLTISVLGSFLPY